MTACAFFCGFAACWILGQFRKWINRRRDRKTARLGLFKPL
ncbi:hypothetical protein BH09VER1_BH09VER1_24880 [soil metagenome]